MQTFSSPDRVPAWAARSSAVVPGTGRRYRKRIRRRIATTQEIREACGLVADEREAGHRIRVRGKRGVAGLPEYRDDVYRGDRHDRCWKRSRSAQWKGAR